MFETLMEKIMLARIILEILALLPSVGEEIIASLGELHSSDSTGTKVSKIAGTAADIAKAASAVIDDANKGA